MKVIGGVGRVRFHACRRDATDPGKTRPYHQFGLGWVRVDLAKIYNLVELLIAEINKRVQVQNNGRHLQALGGVLISVFTF